MKLMLLFLSIGAVSCQVTGGWNNIDSNTIPDDVIAAAKEKMAAENFVYKTFQVTKATEQVKYILRD